MRRRREIQEPEVAFPKTENPIQLAVNTLRFRDLHDNSQQTATDVDEEVQIDLVLQLSDAIPRTEATRGKCTQTAITTNRLTMPDRLAMPSNWETMRATYGQTAAERRTDR